MDKVFRPLVSIVFTSYNHQEFLEQALNSLLDQTYENLEIIVVDDCSTDGSQEILKKYQDDHRINLHLQTRNSGSYVKASNYGAGFAKGDYILFAQCDDFADPLQIEKLIAPFNVHPNIGVCFSKSNLVDKNGEVFSNDLVGREKKFKDAIRKDQEINRNAMREYLSFACVIPNLSAAIIKRDLFNQIDGLSEKFLVVADWELWLSLTKITDFYYLSEPLNNFRQHETTIRSKVKMKVQISEVYAMFYRQIDSNSDEKQTKYFKVGAGAVWFSYFLENKKIWLENFRECHSIISTMEKLPIYYLFLGFSKHFKEYLYRKFAKK